MRFSKRNPGERVRSRSRATLQRTNRLLVEMLEQRGMLAATIGSLADQAVDHATLADETLAPVEASPDAGDGSIGLPEGVRLVICPPVNWAETDPGLIASTAVADGVAGASLSDPSRCVLGGEEPSTSADDQVLRFMLSEPYDPAALGETEATELPPEACLEAASAAQSVSISASHEEPTIAAFIADHGHDPSADAFDGRYNDWSITGFSRELAPPAPEKAEFWGWPEFDSVIDGTVPDAPAKDDGGQSSPENQCAAWAGYLPCSADETDGVADSMSFAFLDGQTVQRGSAQDVGSGTPRFATGASNSRPTGELAAAALWMNLSSTDAGGLHPTGGKRRRR